MLHVCMYVRPIHSQEPVPRQGREQLISTRLVVLLILTLITMTIATNISPAQLPLACTAPRVLPVL